MEMEQRNEERGRRIVEIVTVDDCQECDGTRRPESWDALDWLRRSVFAQVYHISVLLQS
jgi:predicted metal-binding protein